MLKQKQLAAMLFGLAFAAAAVAQPKPVAPADQPKSVAPASQPTALPVAAPDAATQARMKEAEDKLARAAEEEAKRAAVLKAYEEEQAERQKQLAKEKEERDARRARAAYEAQCQFKPVMSDEDIARCRSIHRN
jgi:hypothetical protein